MVLGGSKYRRPRQEMDMPWGRNNMYDDDAPEPRHRKKKGGRDYDELETRDDDLDGDNTTLSVDGESTDAEVEPEDADVEYDESDRAPDEGSSKSKDGFYDPTSKDVDKRLKKLIEASGGKSKKNSCMPSNQVRDVASGYLFSPMHYNLFLFTAFISLAAGTIIMSLYLADSSDTVLGKFQHRWVNVRWHVDGDKKWSHIWDAAALCYGLTFGLGFLGYALYVLTPATQLWNFRVWVVNGVFPMQVMDDLVSNLPLVWLILCVSGQDDFFELLYGSSIWVLAHALFNVAQAHGYDHHFVSLRSRPHMTFLLGLGAVGMFWSTVITSLEYRDSDTKTDVNDGARVGIYTGCGLHLLSIAVWYMVIFNHWGIDGGVTRAYERAAKTLGADPSSADKPKAPTFFPLRRLVQYYASTPNNKSLKNVVLACGTTSGKPAAMCTSAAKKQAALHTNVEIPLSFFVLQADWNIFAYNFIKWSTVRWFLSLAFKLAVTLSFVIGVALRVKLEANEAKPDA